MAESISRVDARRLGLFAQGLLGPRYRSPEALLKALGAVQLDTISVLARSHLLVAWSRLGPVDPARIERAYWHVAASPTSFEYWAHAACILPIARWPEFGYRRRKAVTRGRRWHRLSDAASSTAAIRRLLEEAGPLTSSELGGATRGGPWWDWTEEKIAVEWLLDIGEVACVERRGFKRVYDLTERAIPPELLAVALDDDECLRAMALEGARALGVGTIADFARHGGLTASELTSTVREAASDSTLVEVAVEGSARSWYALPEALERLGSRARARPVLLSPFDSLVWDRDRSERLFGFVHRLEAYTPREKRVSGYFAMPILSGTSLIGTVDPKRERDTFVARHVVIESDRSVPAAAEAIRRAASWIGVSQIRVEQVTPIECAGPLGAALSKRVVVDDDG